MPICGHIPPAIICDMCLIIKKPAGRRIAEDFLAHAWQHNHHGWGSFRVDGEQGPAPGRVNWSRGLHLDELLAHNAALPQQAEAYLHLRRATYGEINPDMAHPHVVRPNLLLMHNGSIAHLAPQDTRLSDTSELARMLCDMLQGLADEQVAGVIRSQGFRTLTAPLIEGSMVVLMDAPGAVRLGRDWHAVRPTEWHEGMWGIEVSNVHTWARRAPQPRAAVTITSIFQPG